MKTYNNRCEYVNHSHVCIDAIKGNLKKKKASMNIDIPKARAPNTTQAFLSTQKISETLGKNLTQARYMEGLLLNINIEHGRGDFQRAPDSSLTS